MQALIICTKYSSLESQAEVANRRLLYTETMKQNSVSEGHAALVQHWDIFVKA